MALIARVKVYFRLRDMKSEVWVNLARLCTEGPTIHFFKALLDEETKPTWEKLKEELVDWSKMGEILTEMCLSNIRVVPRTVWRNTSKNLSASLHRLPNY
ncbi:retrotransposon gag protein [Trifolium pratense]|uniref:Retrotransposon gag protein n=1 Tax=Trifolium pratense TaxID=57577 RepID=A0A2K3P8F7_TRIPR|nr:retrotransposon gag protein [Trifolium pratense]